MIRQNLIGTGSIEQVDFPKLVVGNGSSNLLTLQLFKRQNLLYMPFSAFYCPTKMTLASSSASTSMHNHEHKCKETKNIVDRVHHHVCGHADFSDLRLLLQRNDLWLNDVDQYLSEVFAKCRGCKATSSSTLQKSLSEITKPYLQPTCVFGSHVY